MHIVSNDFELTTNLEELAQQKVQKIERLLNHVADDLKSITVTYRLAQPKQAGFEVDVLVNVPSKSFRASSEHKRLLSALVLSVDKVVRQLQEHFEKIRGQESFDDVSAQKRNV